MSNKHPTRSFADHSSDEHLPIASTGGKNAHVTGTALNFTSEEVAAGCKGDKAGRHKRCGLTPAKVRQMRRLREKGWTYSRLGDRFGCRTASAALRVCRRESWADVE